MKKNFILLMALVLGAYLCAGCSEDSLSETSIIRDEIKNPNEFDKWITANYMKPYNIDFHYRLNDVWTDSNYNLTPSSYKNAIRMAKLTRHLCMDVYDEATGSNAFMKAYFPKIVQLIGSPAFNGNNSIVLGVAEGGRMMTLYMINTLPLLIPTPDSPAGTKLNMPVLNEYFFKTMHHEFAHILHQTRPYSTAFNAVTANGYIGDDWLETYDDKSARKAGFLTAYASKAPDEDFAENISLYVTSTEEEWQGYLKTAGAVGAPLITQKFEIVDSYMELTWGIKLSEVREIVLRRQGEVTTLDLENL